MRKIFTFLFAALMSVGMFATTVTWDNSTLSSIILYDGDGNSFTKDGVTLTVLDGMIAGMDGNWRGYSNDASFKFSTSLGNFTRIEITGNINALGGSGWTQTSPGAVWTGETNETTFGMSFDNVSQIVFTIGEPEPEPEPAEVTVVFAAYNKTVERTVTLPHTFKCSWDNGMDGPDELDIIIHELYNDYYYCNSNMNASGSDQVEVGTEEAPKNDYITIKGVFEGTVTVTGDYFDWMTGEEGAHNYSITISIKGGEPEPEPLFEISYEDKWLKVNPTDGEGQYFVFVEDKEYYDNRYIQYDQTTMQNYLDYVVGVVVGMSAQSNFVFSGEKDIDPDPIYHTWYDNDHLLINHDYVAFVFKFENDARVGDVEYLAFTYAGEPEQEEGIEHIVLTEKAQKVIVDGMIYIVRDGKLFNLTGAQVR